MIALFKQKSPGNIMVLLVFGLLLKLPLFLRPRQVSVSDSDGPLYKELIHLLPVPNGFAAALLAFSLVYLQAIMLNYLSNEYRLISRQNYLTGMAYIIITTLFPEWSYLSAPLVANTFVIWVFVTLFRLYNLQNARPQVFNIGLLIGISSYIYFPSACFIICVLLGLMILKPFRLNEVVLFLLGCLAPYYFYGIYLYLNDHLDAKTFFPQVSVKVPVIASSIWLAAGTVLLTIPFLLGGYYIQTQLRKILIQVRKNWSILLFYLLLAFFVPFVNSNQTLHAWVLVAAPFALFHGCAYFYLSRKILALLLFLVSTGFIFYLQYGTSTWH